MKEKDFKHFIEGKRLYLREALPSDVNENYVKWMNDPDVVQYLESRFSTHTKESLTEYVEKMNADENNVFLVIVLKEGDRHIGNIKIGPINRTHGFAEVGLIIGEKDCWGRGYGSEAVSLASEYAFKKLRLHKLVAGCYAPNAGSARAFEKAGFEKEGIRKKMFLFKGEYVDDLLFGKLNE